MRPLLAHSSAVPDGAYASERQFDMLEALYTGNAETYGAIGRSDHNGVSVPGKDSAPSHVRPHTPHTRTTRTARAP